MGNANTSPSKEDEDGFLGSSILDSAGALCGNVKDTNDSPTPEETPKVKQKALPVRLWETADTMCISSPINSDRKDGSFLGTDDDEGDSLVEPKLEQTEKINPSSALFARALVSEVTDNPRTMKPAAMAEREKRLLKAQEAAKKAQKVKQTTEGAPKPVGAPGGIGQPSIIGSIKHALGTGDDNSDSEDGEMPPRRNNPSSILPPNSLSESRAQRAAVTEEPPLGKYAVTIGLSLSRRHSTVGHPDTVTRQTAFDFNELQDRQYKYVSSTDSSGWLAGGGERGGAPSSNLPSIAYSGSDEMLAGATTPVSHKVAAPDTVHIPIIHINADSPGAVDSIISALARGEVFIPHMGVLPEMLSVNGVSPPDLVVRFGCERNEDIPPDEWPNWCLEFMHNQLYEYFQNAGAVWMKRPFSITLARKVRWKTVKHMNRYFAHAERVVDAWREKGPQYLDPQLSYIEGGATPEEVARPHGIYLLRNGVPTNYFAPNFDPPYTTKMTRSLLMNVLGKSWDKKRREWTSEPVPRLITPGVLVGAMCGCADTQTGFMANEVTNAPLPNSPPTEEYKSLKEEYKNLRLAEASEHRASAMDHESGMALREEEKKAEVKDEWSPPKSAMPSSPMLSETGTASPARSSAAGRAQPPTRNLPQAAIAPNNRRYGPSPSPERGRFRPGTGSQEPVAPSDVGMVSVAATESTVQHMNSDPVRLMERDMQRKKELERARREKEEKDDAEGWLKETLEEEGSGDDEYFKDDGFNLKSELSSPRTPQSRTNKKDHESLEKERAKQISLVGRAKAEVNESAAPGAKYLMNSDNSKKAATPPEVQRSDSGTLSLDYSLDSSLLGEGSLIGQKFDADSSVQTNTSSKAADSVTTSGSTRKRASDKSYAGDDERTADGSAISIQESTSSTEPIPSDEELFAIGWAKALDSSSGSYYYFTLDRSKTVWENPLNPQSVYSGASGSETLQSI